MGSEDDVIWGERLEYLGDNIDSAGDVNGDGYEDIVAGGKYSEFHIFFGSAGGLSEDNVQVLTDGFGEEVSGLGDINGDGRDDLMVSDYDWDSDTGWVHIFYGQSDADSEDPGEDTGEDTDGEDQPDPEGGEEPGGEDTGGEIGATGGAEGSDGGKGCSAAPVGGGWLLCLLSGGLIRRRRR